MGIFNLIQNFSHKKEMRESQDEIIFGEIIRYMVRKHGPMVELETPVGSDHKYAIFRTLKDPILYTVKAQLNRWTGDGAISAALLGSKASLTLVGEVKNYLADPDDVSNMWKTDFANIAKIPLMGDIKLNHQANSIFATKKTIITIGDFVNNQAEAREELSKLIDGELEVLKQHLVKYKKRPKQAPASTGN